MSKTDEMDLAKLAMEVPPLDIQARDRARAALQAHRAAAPTPPLQRGTAFWRAGSRRPRLRRTLGAGAGIGALAAGAAVVFAVTSTSSPQIPAAPRASSVVPSEAPVIESELVALATQITASNAEPTGDASLIVDSRTQGDSGERVMWNLYTDDGAYYAGEDRAALTQAVAKGQDLSMGTDQRKASAAALFAADGDIETARTKMVNAVPNYLGLGLDEAERQKVWDQALANAADVMQEQGITPDPNPPTGKDLEIRVGNDLWNNSYDALSTGAGDPQVRAGVLRLLATIPDVTVEESTTEGKPTLTLTAAPKLSGGSVRQELTLDAQTGTPMTLVSTGVQEGVQSSTSTLEVSRVTVADLN